jgi:hypothetical protein
MAISNVAQVIDSYGTTYNFWVDGVAVKFNTSLSQTTITAFNQPTADNPIDVQIDASDRLLVHYLNSGSPAIKMSDRNGDSGSWSDL